MKQKTPKQKWEKRDVDKALYMNDNVDRKSLFSLLSLFEKKIKAKLIYKGFIL